MHAYKQARNTHPPASCMSIPDLQPLHAHVATCRTHGATAAAAIYNKCLIAAVAAHTNQVMQIVCQCVRYKPRQAFAVQYHQQSLNDTW